METQPQLLSELSTYRLVGDDQLDNWEGVEHCDGGDVPKEREIVITVYQPAGCWLYSASVSK